MPANQIDLRASLDSNERIITQKKKSVEMFMKYKDYSLQICLARTEN